MITTRLNDTLSLGKPDNFGEMLDDDFYVLEKELEDGLYIWVIEKGDEESVAVTNTGSICVRKVEDVNYFANSSAFINDDDHVSNFMYAPHRYSKRLILFETDSTGLHHNVIYLYKIA